MKHGAAHQRHLQHAEGHAGRSPTTSAVLRRRELSREAQQANQAGKYGDAMRSPYQGLAIMRGVQWTPAMEFATSLQGKLDHAMVEPGAQVRVTLTPLYSSPRAASVKMSALTKSCRPAKKDGAAPKTLGAPIAVDPAAAASTTRVTLPDTAPGDYTLEVRLTEDGGAPFMKVLPLHIDNLAPAVQRLRARLAKAPKRDGLATAEYALALYDRADSGDLNPARVKFPEEFAASEAILAALEAGSDQVRRQARRFAPRLSFRRR